MITNLRHRDAEPVRPLTDRERMELRAIEVAREVGFSHRPPRDRAFVRHFDADRREWYEEGVFGWPCGGTVRVDSRTLDIIAIERPTP